MNPCMAGLAQRHRGGGSEERIKELLYATWELLAWYDGYFYTPISYKIDGIEQEVAELSTVNYYITDKNGC